MSIEASHMIWQFDSLRYFMLCRLSHGKYKETVSEQILVADNYNDTKILQVISGVTRVGDTQGGN